MRILLNTFQDCGGRSAWLMERMWDMSELKIRIETEEFIYEEYFEA